MVRPLIPIMEYYANYNYIVTELCENKDKPFLECNGKCYLAKEIKKVNHDNHEHESNLPKINFGDFPISIVEQFEYRILSTTESMNSIGNTSKNIQQDEYLFSILQPPQFTIII